MVIILEHCQHIVQFRAVHENHPHPMVDHGSWSQNRFAILFGFEFFNLYLTVSQLGVGGGLALAFRQPIDPQHAVSAMQFLLIASFGQLDVAIKRRVCFFLQLHGRRLAGIRRVGRGGYSSKKRKEEKTLRHSPVGRIVHLTCKPVTEQLAPPPKSFHSRAPASFCGSTPLSGARGMPRIKNGTLSNCCTPFKKLVLRGSTLPGGGTWLNRSNED